MKSLPLLLLAIAALLSPHLYAQEEEVQESIPYDVGKGLGALAGACMFEAQLVVEQIQRNEIQKDEIWRATRDLKASKGVIMNANKHLETSKAYFNENEQNTIGVVIKANTAILEEMDALLELLAARSNGDPTTLANGEFQSKRADAIKLLVEIGFDEKLFE